MIWYFKSNQKQNNRNRKEIKERERRKLPGAHLPGPARPSPSPLPPCRLPLPVGRGEAWRAPERPRPPPASPWPPPASSSTPGDATHLPASLPHSPASSSSPLDLSLTRPNGAAATDELPRGHRHPLASPMRSKAPPRPPLSPHRATRSRTRCNAATIAVSIAGRRGSSPSIRRRLRFPELVIYPIRTTVSSCTFCP